MGRPRLGNREQVREHPRAQLPRAIQAAGSFLPCFFFDLIAIGSVIVNPQDSGIGSMNLQPDLHWMTPTKTTNFTMSIAALSDLKTPNEEQADQIKTSTSI
jgi:hypothetical protein